MAVGISFPLYCSILCQFSIRSASVRYDAQAGCSLDVDIAVEPLIQPTHCRVVVLRKMICVAAQVVCALREVLRIVIGVIQGTSVSQWNFQEFNHEPTHSHVHVHGSTGTTTLQVWYNIAVATLSGQDPGSTARSELERCSIITLLKAC